MFEWSLFQNLNKLENYSEERPEVFSISYEPWIHFYMGQLLNGLLNKYAFRV